jgi:monoamine oxidase
MARAKSTTALLEIMGRLLADERRARGLGPLSRGRRRGLSRRAFLGGALGAAGVAACGGPERPPTVAPHGKPTEPLPSGPSGPVIVVGAGTAGLVCAYRLQQAKVPVRLIEASTRPGGRMFSDSKTFGPELTCELGGELIDSNHETMQALVKELGLTLDDLKPEGQDLHPVFHFGGKSHSEKDITEALRPAAAAMTKDLESLTDYEDTPYESGKLTQELDAMSIDAWLKARGITGLAGDLVRVAFTTELGLEADELSCIIMFEMFRLQGDKLELFGDSDERYRIAGGNDQVPRILAERLGNVVEYESRLESLRRGADGRLELGFAGPVGSVTSERVVLALPFSLLRQVPIHDSVGLSERKKRSIAELGYGTNSKLMLGFKSRFWNETKKNGEFFGDGAYQSGWDTSRLQPGTEGILTVYTGGKRGVAIGEGTPEAARDAMLDALAPVFPGAGKASNGKVARFHWPSSPLALGSYSTFKVGQLTAFGGVESEVEGKNLHFAGEHTSLDFQGFMEGAAESGERAAREVIEALRGA